MTITTRYEKHKPTTMGYAISLITTYTSVTEKKIKEVEKMIKESLENSILITEVSDDLQGEEEC